MDRPLVSAGPVRRKDPQKRAGGPLLHRRTKTTRAIAMKLGGNDGTSGRYIAAKFHCSGFDSFCAAAVQRCNFGTLA